MKTKNIILYVFIIGSLISCEKFLEEEPRAVIAPETFFASDNDARQAIQAPMPF